MALIVLVSAEARFGISCGAGTLILQKGIIQAYLDPQEDLQGDTKRVQGPNSNPLYFSTLTTFRPSLELLQYCRCNLAFHSFCSAYKSFLWNLRMSLE